MTPMTLTEKILARHADRDSVRPGDNVWIDVDVLMTHDVCGPGTIGVFKQHFGETGHADSSDADKMNVLGFKKHFNRLLFRLLTAVSTSKSAGNKAFEHVRRPLRRARTRQRLRGLRHFRQTLRIGRELRHFGHESLARHL